MRAHNTRSSFLANSPAARTVHPKTVNPTTVTPLVITSVGTKKESGDEMLNRKAEAVQYMIPPRNRFNVHIMVTPTLAEAWLLLNENNRNEKTAAQAAMASDMKNGRWDHDNGTAIRFSLEGKLIDGQNRLKACIQAGVPFGSMVCFGLHAQAKDTVDIGTPRSAADRLTFEGIGNARAFCAATKIVIIHEDIGLESIHNSWKHPSKPQIAETAKEILPELKRSAELCTGKMCLSKPVAIALHIIFSRQNTEIANNFFMELRDGINLEEFNPVRLLRERLISESNRKSRMELRYQLALVLQAWIAYRDGVPMRSLRWRCEGPRPAPFPDINKDWVK